MSNIYPYKGVYPKINKAAFIAPTATIIGDVTIGKNSGVWFNSVIRGDVAKINIGNYTNIQDGSVVHVTRNGGDTTIGNYVTIGHKAMIHACILQDYCFIGMCAIDRKSVV
jgi:carbonic anhydrase/acetyltransferase-like protein (isoleucine patch superfamily)